MFDEIAVDRIAVRGPAEMNPVFIDGNGMIPLLKENDIRNHFRTRVRPESVVRQPDRAEEISSFSKVFPHFRGLFIHCITGGHESDHAARTYLVNSFRKEIVVDAEPELIVRLVVYLIIAEWDVAYREIEEVFAVCGLKPGNGYIRLRVKLFCYPSGDTVKLHAVKTGIGHLLRQETEEVADAH